MFTIHLLGQGSGNIIVKDFHEEEEGSERGTFVRLWSTLYGQCTMTGFEAVHI